MQYFNNTSQNQRPGDVSPVHFPAAMNGEWRAPDLAASPITLQLLLRQTGLGIKVRFLLALMCIAIIPAISLVFLLGDPAGSERQATVSQALFMQAKAQGTALNQALEARRNTLAGLAKQPELAQLLSGAAGGTELLQAAQQADQASMAWILTKADGAIVAGSPGSKLSGRVLGKTQVVAHPDLLNQLMHAAIKAQAIPQPVIGFDEKAHRGWIAFAAPVGNGALLAVWNMSSVTHDLVTTVPALEGSVAILLDASQRLIASAGTISGKQQPFAAVPGSLATIRLNVNTATALAHDSLTGHDVLGVGMPISVINGRYLLLVPQDVTLVPSSRVYFSGRNAPLLLLSIGVAVILVATWVALPIIRPIRRATRSIGATTQEVRQLADDARTVAQEHSLGTEILSGASRRLSGRRQSIIRDSVAIGQLCGTLIQRVHLLYRWAHPLLQQHIQDNTLAGGEQNTARQSLEAFQYLQQTTQEIHRLAKSIATGLEHDQSLSQLDQAMGSAREISSQFEDAGKQLEMGAQQLETAARSLL